MPGENILPAIPHIDDGFPLRLSALPLMMTGILAACVGTAFHARPMITISRSYH